MEKTKRKTLADFKDFDFECLNNQIAIYIPPIAKVSEGGIVIPDEAMQGALKYYFDRNPYHLVVNASSGAISADINAGDIVKIDLSVIQPDMFFVTPVYKDDNFLLLDFFSVKGKLTQAGIDNLDILNEFKFIDRVKETSKPKPSLLTAL